MGKISLASHILHPDIIHTRSSVDKIFLHKTKGTNGFSCGCLNPLYNSSLRMQKTDHAIAAVCPSPLSVHCLKSAPVLPEYRWPEPLPGWSPDRSAESFPCCRSMPDHHCSPPPVCPSSSFTAAYGRSDGRKNCSSTVFISAS